MVRRRVPLALALILSMLVAGSLPLSSLAQEAAQTPQAVTTADPDIPVEELSLLLKPLTKDDLLAEAEAWQVLLKAKAEEIAKAEIAVSRQNREIEKAEGIQEKAEEAKAQLEEVKEKAAEAKASGDLEKIAETEAAAHEAGEKVEAVSEAVKEAKEAAEKTAEVHEASQGNTQESLEQAGQAVEEATSGNSQASVSSAGRAEDLAEESAEKEQALETAAATAERAQEVKEEEKVELLERVNALREERTVITDRLKAILDELETKTDSGDSGTLATITDYRLYISSVQGIRVDVKDTTSTWIALKGWLVSDEGGLRWAQNIGLFFGILLAAWLLSRLLSRMVHRGLKMTERFSQLLEDFLAGAVRWVVMIVGIIMAISALEVSIGPLLAIVGAAGFVIAFALQDSLSNFASGIMILFFRPFDVGDVVDAGGVSGTVMTMNLVSTTIKTFDNKDMLVPNNKIWSDVITNATGVATRRVDMEFGIGYDDDIDKAEALLREIVTDHPKVLKDPEPNIRMHTLADSSVNFICRPWVRTVDYWDVYWEVTKTVKLRFDEEGIGIPFPQRDVHLYIEEGGETEKPLPLTKRKAASGRDKVRAVDADDEAETAAEG